MDASISTISIDLTNDEPNEPTESVINNTNNENNDKDYCSITPEVTASSFPSQITTPSVVQSMQKPHVLPAVYLQLPTTGSKTPTNNVILNTVQLSNINNIKNNKNSNLTSGITLPTSTNVINKPQQIVIQKPIGNIQAIPVVPVAVSSSSVTKNTVAYLTMLQPMAKSNDMNCMQLSSVTKTKSDNVHILPKTNANSNNSQQLVIAPLPKLTTNRLPITATTNCVQSKFTFMPLSLTNSTSPQVQSKKFINVKLTDGPTQTDNRTITVMCDSTAPDKDEVKSVERKGEEENKALMCNEVIDLDSPDKKQTDFEEKSYQLSIVEDSNNSVNDINYSSNKTEETTDKTKHDTSSSQLKDTTKFTKHGISILKKSFNVNDRKVDQTKSSLIISPVPNLITTISDANTKEVKITTSSNFENKDPVIITPTIHKPQKSERRRKSQFSYRKDYDEIEVTSTVDWDNKQPKFDEADVTLTKLEEEIVNSNEKNIEDLVEIEVIKESMDINMNDDNDVSKILTWDDGIGTLPGSDLKFQMNEFGLLEYLTKDDYKKIVDKKTVKLKEEKKGKCEIEYHCLSCGCYGHLSEFINTKFCSNDCQEVYEKNKEKENKLKKKKKPYYKKNESNHVSKERERESSPSEEENTSNENSQDKYNYPWNCTKKGFSWAKYLEHIKAKAAPVKLFKDAFPYSRNGFRAGMKLEGIDPQHPSYFCVLSVVEVIGYRLRLHFDGYSENYDFWVNADSMDIFPAGWCEKFNHVLHPPRSYEIDEFNWSAYLKQTRSVAAPKHLFANRAGNVSKLFYIIIVVNWHYMNYKLGEFI